jgi:hypothetical protein
MTNSNEYQRKRDEITKKLSDSAEIARYSLENGTSNVAECYAKTEAAQLEAQQAIDQLVALAKIDGAIEALQSIYPEHSTLGDNMRIVTVLERIAELKAQKQKLLSGEE